MKIEWEQIKSLEEDNFIEIKNAILGVINNYTSGYWFKTSELKKRFAIVNDELAMSVFNEYPLGEWDKEKYQLIKENQKLRRRISKFIEATKDIINVEEKE